MLLAGDPVEQIRQTGVEIDLDEDRHSEKANYQRLGDDLFTLEPEEQDQRREKGDEGSGAEPGQQAVKRHLATR